MAKKRRKNNRRPQRERSPSMIKQLTGVAKVALAVGTGAALFNRSKIGQSIKHEIVPALGRTVKNYNKELLGSRRKATDIYEAFEKTVGKRGKNFQKTLEEVRLERYKTQGKYKPRVGKKGSLFSYVHDLNQTTKSNGFNKIDAQTIKKLEKKAIEEMVSKYGDKYDEKVIKKIVRSTVSKRNEINADKEVSTRFLEKTLATHNIDLDDAKKMVEGTLDNIGYISKSIKSKNRQYSKTLMEEIKKISLEHKKQDTRDNLLLNRIGKKLGIDNLEEKFLGSKAMTLGELLDNEDILELDDVEELKKIVKDVANNKNVDINSWKELKKMVEADEEWKNVIVDRHLRIRTNKQGEITEVFDNSEFAKTMEDLLNHFNASLPGKVLTKGIDLKNFRDRPNITFFLEGTKSMLSAIEEGGENNELQRMKIGIRSGMFKNTIYDVTEDSQGNLHMSGESLGEALIFKMDRGTVPRLIQNYLGRDTVDNLSSQNKLAQMLDFNQDGRPNMIKRFFQRFTKFGDENWQRNIINRKEHSFLTSKSIQDELKYLQETLDLTADEALHRLHEDNQAILEEFAQLAGKKAITKDTIQNMIDVLTSEGFPEKEGTDKVIELLKLTLNDDVESILDYLADDANMNLKTHGLKELVESYRDNTLETLKRIDIQTSVTKKIPVIDIEMPETNVMFIEGIVRQNILKEVMAEGDVVNSLFDPNLGLNISGQQTESLYHYILWQRFEKASYGVHNFDAGTYALRNESSFYNQLLNDLDKTYGGDELLEQYVRTFEEMKNQYGFLHKGVDGNPNEIYYSEYGEYDAVFLSKMSLGKSLVENANALIKELAGGKEHLDQVSPVTLVAQYMVNRLSYGVDEAGLGLSHKSLTSPFDAAKNIFLKRVLPAMAVYTGFDYLNDLSQDVTGTGITGALANTARNIDLLGRRVAYNTGLGQAMDWLKQTSVIGEYWTGSRDFQTVEERKDWYMNGYSPVRKSRFWSFGSASEFRGGDITFFQPNYWRRANSDYYDKWLYGSNSEKWAHSIIPTPTHPFSTINYLLDPYWLEKKHMDDAPTPLTGKMFSEGTPWGAVLNPTVGQVIKPVRMLPEVRKRLTGKGHDAKSIIKNINERKKLRQDRRQKGAADRDLLVVNGTDIRNATYIPYGNPTPNELVITNGYAKGINYMKGLSNLSAYQVPEYDPVVDGPFTGGGEYGGNYYGGGGNGSGYGSGDNVVSDYKIVNQIAQGVTSLNSELEKTGGGLAKGIIANLNNAMKRTSNLYGPGHSPTRMSFIGKNRRGSVNSASPDSSSEGTYIYNNLVNEYNTYTSDYYDSKYMPGFLDNGFGSQTRDYMKDIVHSGKQLSGIYGFLADVITGGPETSYRWENAGSYQSFSSRFWDAGVGGLGGGIMEISRRFFPSSDKSRVDYNPLRNNVADWLPDYLQVGNPFSKLTKGAMRLPGRGYESLNELHPDEYASDGYGAFDRFKILADVAPNSKEYKIWHNIVKHQTLRDNPYLKEEFEEIESRTKRMRGSHEFYEYQYVFNNTKNETAIVKEITSKGQIITGDNKVLTLAGINLNDNYQGDEIGSIIAPGSKITYTTSESVAQDEEKGVVRNAVVYGKGGSTSLNKQLIDMGVADRDQSDTSALGQLGVTDEKQQVLGGLQEIIAHARIPIIHNKLMHIETALESFKSEQMYGANFQTWDHPIEGFVKPMMNEAMGQSMLRRAMAVAYKDFHFNTVLKSKHVGGVKRFGSGLVLATLDPAAMLGGTLNWMTGLNNGRVGIGDQPLGKFSKGMEMGSAIGTMAWGYANADNPLKAGISFAAASVDIFNKMEVGELIFKKTGKMTNWKGAAAVGAAIGLTVSAIKNPDFNWDRMTQKWQPKKYQKMNEINEYFDRLEYIKYKGLYEDAARKAALLEGTPVKMIFDDIDKNKKRIQKLKEKQEKLLKKHNENSTKYKAKSAEIQAEIQALTQRGNQMFTGGKYTKAAIAYKKAMESTIYGLSPGATQDEILAAVPDQYKDYFQAFMEETDEGERKKILSHLPDYLKRPLQAAWGEKMDDTQSNKRYFRSHKLPGVNWRGWKPNINLKHVKMKTIENEGMLLSDFGYYESEKAKPSYMMAPEIENYDQTKSWGLPIYGRLTAELRGLGVIPSNVSLEKTSAPGLWITSDIKQSITDRTELATNSMTNIFQGVVSTFF